MRIFDRLQGEHEDCAAEKPRRKKIRLKELFGKNGIYVKLLAVIMFFLVVPCVLVNLWANYYIKNVVLDYYMEAYLDSVYESIQNGINHYIDQISAYSMYIFTDGTINKICKDENLTDAQKEEGVRNYLNKFWTIKDLIGNVDIVVDDNLRIRKTPIEMSELNPKFVSKIRHTNILISSDLVTDENGEKYIVFGREVYSGARRMCELYIYVPEAKIYDVLEEVNNDENLMFLAADDKIMSHPVKSSLGCYMLFPEEMSATKDINEQRVGDYFYNYRPMNLKIATEGKWMAESRMSYRWLYQTTGRLKKETTVILIIEIIISIIFAVFIPVSLLKSLSILKRRMSDFARHEGALEKKPEFSFGEISELENSFNKMVVEINDLMERNNIEKEKQRRAELQALQAQINPHFIYNALDAIAWYAKIEKQGYLADMVCELATFFRISLHKGDTTIKVSEEISHVESYVAIEQMRFPGLFEVEYKIQEDLMDEKIIKIILQPIVENSIKHGFENMDSGGRINITGYRDEYDDIIFEVEDNGHGFDFDPLADRGERVGYGIHNVNERIQLEYGKEYGISFRSIPGEGTTAKIRIKSMT